MSGTPDRDASQESRLEQIRKLVESSNKTGAPLDSERLCRENPDLIGEINDLLAQVATLGALDVGNLPTIGMADSKSPDAENTLAESRFPATPRGPQPEQTEKISVSDSQEETMEQTNPIGRTITFEPTKDILGGAKRRRTVDSDTPTKPMNSEKPLPTGQRIRYVGDYELLSILGQGGMGIVYKAKQVSLNRLVALKMIRSAEFASDEQIRRFQNEAESVALLDDPGIVPIYEVGQYEDQRYFSMKLIEGSGLDKKIKEYAKDPHSGAAMIAKIALAIDHAHRRGILHRDLKPANILIDGQGDPHVTDFGLAKKIEGDEGLTVSGAIMGTPAYMAPEQALGRTSQITTSTDIYGIGAILYATLTGKAPFAADSLLETLEHVRQDPPQPPSRINAELPIDLEVICLKCLEKDPRRRYETARDVADDLTRWVKGEPISARPVGKAVRTWMWCKRNPILAALATSLALALLAGVAGVTIQWREAVHQRGLALKARDLARYEEEAARKAEAEARSSRDAAILSEKNAIASEKAARKAEAEAESSRDAAIVSEKNAVASEKAAVAARTQAEQNATLAGQQTTLALKTIQSLIMRVRSISDPGSAALKEDITKLALAQVDKVAAGYEVGTSKEATTAAALQDLGKIYRELGQTEKSFRMFMKCDEIYQERLKIKDRNDASRMNLALNYMELATAMSEFKRDMKAALDYNLKAVSLFQEILDEPRTPNPGDLPLGSKNARALLSEAHQRVGGVHLSLGQIAEALDRFRKVANIRRALVDEFPNDLVRLQELSFAHLAIAEAAFRLGEAKEAEEAYRQALTTREKLSVALPIDRKVKAELGDVNYMFGWFYLRSRKLDLAFTFLDEARKIREALVEEDTRNAINRRALGMTYYFLGVRAQLAQDQQAAKSAFDKSLLLRKALAEASPENDRRQMELMLGLARTGDSVAALKIADRVAAGPNLDNETRYDLARCYSLCSDITKTTDPQASSRLRQRCVEIIKQALLNGYTDRVSLETENDLNPVRDDPEFGQIIKSLGSKS